MGVTAPLIHLANSAAVAHAPGTWETWCGPGLVLYGYHQSYDPPERSELQPGKCRCARRWRCARASFRCATLPAGQGVGYNERWVASRPSRVAVLSAGYADGLFRARSPIAAA